MEIVEADQYRVRNNWIYFPTLDYDPIRVPFGLGFGIRRKSTIIKGQHAKARAVRPRLRLQAQGRHIAKLEMETRDSWRTVLPPFSRTIAGTVRGRPTFVIYAATLEEERRAACRIVQRGHYLNPRSGGLVLIVRIADPRAARDLQARWWPRLEPDIRKRYGTVERATGGLSNIVAALYLERLMHGHPAGRSAIYAHDGKRSPNRRAMNRPGFRRKVVSELGLYWISRVAVEAPFRGIGIGSALCDAAREVAASRMLEPGRYVELIRRLSIAEYNAIVGGKGDFLTGHSTHFAVQLPFTLRTPYLSRKPTRAWNAARERWESPPPSTTGRPLGDCLAYYYARAGSMVIRTRPWRGSQRRTRP